MIDDTQRRETLEMYGDVIRRSDNNGSDNNKGNAKENLKFIPGSDDLSFVINGKKK